MCDVCLRCLAALADADQGRSGRPSQSVKGNTLCKTSVNRAAAAAAAITVRLSKIAADAVGPFAAAAAGVAGREGKRTPSTRHRKCECLPPLVVVVGAAVAAVIVDAAAAAALTQTVQRWALLMMRGERTQAQKRRVNDALNDISLSYFSRRKGEGEKKRKK